MCTGIFKAQQYKYTPTLFFGAIYSPDIFLSFLLPRQITDATLIQLSIYCPRLQVLVSVWLQRFCFLTTFSRVTLLWALLWHRVRCVFLQSLSHCELITDDGIRHLGSGPCAHDRLEVIELDNCPLITDASLEHLKSCHSLDRIELYDCQQITRAGIKRLRVSFARE